MEILNNITLLDFSRLLPGPLGTQGLAQWGATIIKVEHPQRSDMARVQPPFAGGKSLFYEALNHGKEVWPVDYTTTEGKEAVLEKIAEVDVLVEQFRPGVMAQWGLDYDSLKAVKPDLIYISLSGFGQEGPLAQTAGHDLNYLAETGLLSLNMDEQGRPVIPGFQLADIGSGSYLLQQACLAGLLQRERTGEGSYWDVNMAAGLLPLQVLPLSQHWGGLDPYSFRLLSGGLVNYNVYACADDHWIALAALELKFWRAFCELVERPGWIRDNPLELSVQVFPKAEVEDLFRRKDRDEWLTLAEGQDVCLSPVRSLAEARDFGLTQDLGKGLKSIGHPLIPRRQAEPFSY